MKLVKSILLVMFLISCSSDDPVSPSSTCSPDLVGSWVFTASGYIEGGCEGVAPTTTSFPHTLTLSEDCSFTTNQAIASQDCSDPTADSYSVDACSGSWATSATEVAIASNEILDFMGIASATSLLGTIGYSYIWNDDKTEISQCLEGTSNGNPIGSYSKYSKQ